jgi:hypothetical protein
MDSPWFWPQEQDRRWQAYIDAISNYWRSLEDVVLDEFSEWKEMVMIWEQHNEARAVHESLRRILEGLKDSENKPILYIEFNREQQHIFDEIPLHLSDEECINYLISNWIRPVYENLIHHKTIVHARRLGFKVVAIDDPYDFHVQEIKRNPYHYEDDRDRRMAETIQKTIHSKPIPRRWIVLIWSNHCHTLIDPRWGKIQTKRLWRRLYEEFWKERVTTIRYVDWLTGINGVKRAEPTPRCFDSWVGWSQPKWLIVMPSEWLFEWDEHRGIASDFVILPRSTNIFSKRIHDIIWE